MTLDRKAGRESRPGPAVKNVCNQDYTSTADDFRAAIAAAGLNPPDRIEPGRLYRFPGLDKGNGNRAGWAKLFDDGLGGVFGDFSSGLKENWQARRDKPYTADERHEFQRRCREERAAREAEQAESHAEAAKRAQAIYDTATGDPTTHPYAIAKRVPFGDRVRRGAWDQRRWADALIIPLYDADGQLSTLEAINVDGSKNYLKGGDKTGAGYFFGRIRGADRVLIGEGVATVAAVHGVTKIPAVAAMDAGNLLPVARNVRKHAPDAEIIFCADNDIREDRKNPGIEAAQAAAKAVKGKVAVPDMDGRKYDFWDVWNEKGPEAVEKCISTPTLGESGESGENPHESRDTAWRIGGELWRIGGEFAEFKPPDYPVDALGPLADAATAIAEKAQLDPAMAGQCVLAAAGLLAQSRANVQTLAGVKPLSLFLLTIGESGDGKTTAENAALTAVLDWQRTKTKEYTLALKEHAEECRAAIKRKELPPAPPRSPYIIMRDGTIEGIRRGFGEGVPSQGCVTSEGAVMLGGYGMTTDQRAKTGAALNAIWDDGEVSVSRAMTGRVQLYDRRFMVHWLIQPAAAADCLNDLVLSNIGFWPRFLAAWPAPNKPRSAIPFHPGAIPAIGEFWRRCSEMLALPQGESCEKLPVISATAEAKNYIAKFFEKMEEAAKTRGGALAQIKPFAIRATEQVCRIAGVLAVYAGGREINLDTARNAARLAGYSLETWRSIFGSRHDIALKADAQRLLEWMVAQPGRMASETAILRLGPRCTRSRSRRDAALAMLEQSSIAKRAGNQWAIQ